MLVWRWKEADAVSAADLLGHRALAVGQRQARRVCKVQGAGLDGINLRPLTSAFTSMGFSWS